jgi:putative nucleotidyltransferase with HDIG domain
VTAPPKPAPLSPAGRVYVTLVGVVGCTLFAWCGWTIVRDGLYTNKTWLIFTALTFASARLTLKVPSVDARFSLTEMFAFASMLLFGPATGAVTLAIDAVIYSLRQRLPATQAFFNFGNLSVAAFVSGSLFFIAANSPPLANQTVPTEMLVLPLALMTAAYFGINSGLIAVAIGFQKKLRPFDVWRTQFMSLGPAYAAGASGALLLIAAVRQVHFGTLALLVPVIVVCYLMLRSSFGRLEDAQQHANRLNGLYFSTIETLATAIDAKDRTTHDHIRRVQQGAMALTRELGYTDETTLKAIEAASLLHDTGKIAVPEHILNKPGRLTPMEFEQMKLHAPIGAEILSSIDFPYPVVPIVRHHHENWDGTGYPDGLRGTDIPIGARILSVVDCFDALTSDRPYRARMTDDDALAILRERRGTMYDPTVVDTFLASYKRIMPPSQETVHPVARAVALARSRSVSEEAATGAGASDTPNLESIGAFTSLSRAVGGEAGLSDLGALVWMLVRHVVPCTGMAVFLPEERTDSLVSRFAAGPSAGALRNLRYRLSRGAVGWTAVNRRMIVNGEAALGIEGGDDARTLPSWVCTLPLVHDGTLVAVLALYSPHAARFADAQAHLLELLAPRLAATVAHVTTTHAAADPVAGLPARAEIHVVHRAAGE